MRQARHHPGGDSDRGWVSPSGRIIIVLNPEEVQDDLVRDMTEVLTLMCARLCGRRLACEHADAAIRAAEGAA
jgi:putative resolvase